MKKSLFLLLFLVIQLIPHPARAEPSSTYYESVSLDYRIGADRTLEAREDFTIRNPSWHTYEYTITRQIPTESTKGVAVDGGVSYDVSRRGGKTTITIRFRLGGVERLTYSIRYTADEMISGSGPAYKSRLGGITLSSQSFPYRNYVIEVRGPPRSKLFLTDPDAEIISEDPPSVRYRTSVGAPGSYDGLPAIFYLTPAYYKVTLVERVSNPGPEPSDLVLDVLLFNHGQSQFTALVNSDPPLSTMYVDEENNWYGGIGLRLEPDGSRDVRLELIWVCEIHSPEIDKRGTLDEIPSALDPYLKEDEFWEVKDPAIALKAKEIVGKEKGAYRIAERILGWVSDLENRRIAERQGALLTLQKGYGDCDCFSDLTIALARAAGLPARLSFGWAYEEGELEGHAWVEFYLPRAGWQPADPMWAKTSGDYLCKLDPSHILRGRRGLTSSNSTITRTSYGGNPRIAQESSSSVQLGTSEAAQVFVQAAETTLRIAERLTAKEEEAMISKLQLARQKLDDARLARGEKAIRLARESLRYSNEVVRALGKPLELEPRVHRYLFIVLAGTIAGAGIAIILAIRSRTKGPV